VEFELIEIGKVQKFKVLKETKSGFYLEPIDIDSDEEVFMPPALAPLNLKIDQEIEAFIYLDSTGGMIANSSLPYAQVDEYALMNVIDVQGFGAFLDWGIEKDLLVPGNQQKMKMKKFEEHLVRVCLEEETDRIYGTTKLGKYIESSDFDINEGDSVSLVPAQKTELGYKVIINKKFIGMIYHNEIFSNIRIGQPLQGVVKKIRVDGLVDTALQTQGVQNIREATDKILIFLNQKDGKSELHDKSSPEAIKSQLSMSKKTFKNAIGILYKQRKILIHKTGIELTEQQD
jgi:uncharacterized protein